MAKDGGYTLAQCRQSTDTSFYPLSTTITLQNKLQVQALIYLFKNCLEVISVFMKPITPVIIIWGYVESSLTTKPKTKMLPLSLQHSNRGSEYEKPLERESGPSQEN